MTTLLDEIENKYEVLEKLGEGGMGAVYKVRHLLLKEVRVIKRIRPKYQESENLAARFRREARVATKLKHPNIAQLYDFAVSEDGTAFIVMEYVEGPTLGELRPVTGSLPTGLILEIAQQSLKALGFLHRQGFIHRDVAPDNLIVSGSKHGHRAVGPLLVKLIDLGIAKRIDAGAEEDGLTRVGEFVGKIRYASPEQLGGAKGNASIDARCDLYSFGVVLYELLTGRHPVAGDSNSAIMAGHLLHPPLDFAESDPEGKVSPELRRIVHKALAKNPDDRFANAQAFSGQLGRLRSRFSYQPEDLERALESARSSKAQAPRQRETGSSQSRRDRHPETPPAPSPKAPSLEDPGSHDGKTRIISPQPRAPRQEPPSRLETLVAEARELLAAKNVGQALERLSEANRLDPDDQEVQALLMESHERLAELERQIAERRCALEIAAATADIDSLVERGDLERAGRLLDQAAGTYGEEALGNRRGHLEELQRQAAEITGLTARIRALLETEEAEDAERLLEKALGTHGNEAVFIELQQPLAELKRKQQQAREEQRRRQQASELLGKAQKLTQDGRFEDAQKLIDEVLALQSGAGDNRGPPGEDRTGPDATPARPEPPRVEAPQETVGTEPAPIGRPRPARRGQLIAGVAIAIVVIVAAGFFFRQATPPPPAEATSGDQSVEIQSDPPPEGPSQEGAPDEVGAHLEEASRLADAEDFEGALRELGLASGLEPGNLKVQALVDRTEAAIQERRHEKIRGVTRRIRAHLDGNDLEPGRKLLAKALATYGAQPSLNELRGRLEALERDQGAEALFQEAEGLISEQKLSEAAGKLQRLLEVQPENQQARQLLRETAEILDRQQREQERREAMAEESAAIEALLAAGEFDQALDRATSAIDAYGSGGPFEALQERLEQARIDRREAARKAEAERARQDVAALLSSARELVVEKQLEAARAKVSEALRRDPQNQEAAKVMAELEATLAKPKIARGDLILPGPGVVLPKALKILEPEYPPLAERRGIRGKVVVRVLVDENGKVIQTKVQSGNALLHQAAEKAAAGSTFKPATKDGVAGKMWAELTFGFRLEG